MIKTFISILSLAAAIGLYFVHIEPMLANIEILKEEESEFNEALEKARQLEEVRERLSTQFLSFGEKELQTLEKFLPTTVDSVHLIFDVNSIAQKYNAELLSADVTGVRSSQRRSDGTELEVPYHTVVFKFSVDMDYKIFLAFIADLEQSLRLMDVSRIGFSTGVDTQSSGPGNNKIEIEFNTYTSN